jgi:hypothetical protein
MGRRGYRDSWFGVHRFSRDARELAGVRFPEAACVGSMEIGRQGGRWKVDVACLVIVKSALERRARCCCGLSACVWLGFTGRYARQDLDNGCRRL